MRDTTETKEERRLRKLTAAEDAITGGLCVVCSLSSGATANAKGVIYRLERIALHCCGLAEEILNKHIPTITT